LRKTQIHFINLRRWLFQEISKKKDIF